MVAALGGPGDFVDNPSRHLAEAPVIRPVYMDGVLAKVDAFVVGNAIIELGGGRRQVGEALDMSVGFSQFASIGTQLDKDTPLVVVHAASDEDADKVSELIRNACTTSLDVVQTNSVIKEILTGNS